MNYITAKDASIKWKINLRSVQRMCTAGQIEGARKISNVWWIPEYANPVTKRKIKNLVGKQEIINAYRDFIFGCRDKFDRFFDGEYSFKDKLTKAYFYAVKAYRYYPVLNKMLPYFEISKELLENTGLKLPELSLTMGGHFALTIFLYKGGIADEVSNLCTEIIPIFEYLTGRKSGLDLLFQSALAYHRGNINYSQLLAYKAIFTNDIDPDIKLGVSYILAHIALLNGNLDGWDTVIEMLHSIDDGSEGEVTKTTFEIVESELALSAGLVDGIPEWLKNGDFADKSLTITSMINAYLVHIRYLIRCKEFEKAIAMAEMLLEDRSSDYKAPPHGKLYLYILAAVCYNKITMKVRATQYLKSALEIAEPDGLYMFFAEYDNGFDGLTDDFFKKNAPDVYKKLCEIRNIYLDNYTSARSFLQGSMAYDNLTNREQEIARLVAEGYQNHQIAEKLFVSTSTVNYHIRNIYKKLGVNSRTMMINRLYFYYKKE